MRLSNKGAQFVAREEGMILHPYNDPAGYATIGIGHLLHRSRVTLMDKIRWAGFRRSQAYKLLEADAERFAGPLRAHAASRHWNLNQAQFDALTSFSFNVGTGWLKSSTLERTLTDAARHGHRPSPAAVSKALAMWSKAGGRTLTGLRQRRQREARLFNTGRYT